MEDETQLGILRRQKYHVLQGYLFSKPLPGNDIPAWVEAYLAGGQA